MGKTVTTIPATISRFTAVPINEVRKRRAAGYARVSTDKDEQLTSYEAQVDYYTNYIKSREDWTFISVFTDEGISVTSTAKRDGFNNMVRDALAGNIDLIITKSVSRFARNTVDSLSTIRKLKEKGVEVYFEKENIWTFDGKGELLIAIMSSLAQEESRSISENCTWGQRKRFSDGKVSVPYKRFLGYDKGENDTLKINEKEADANRMNYAVGPMISKRAHIGWTTTGHTGEDVTLYTYLPKNERVVGLIDSTDIALASARAFGVNLNTLTDRIYVNANKAFAEKGASITVDKKSPDNPVLIVKKGTTTIEIPESKNYIILNGTKRTFNTITVQTNDVFYVSSNIIKILR